MVEWKQSDSHPSTWYLLDTDASVDYMHFKQYEACNGFGSYLDFPTLAQAMAWCETQQNNPDEYVSPGMLKAALATQYPDENRISSHSMQRAIAAALKQYKAKSPKQEENKKSPPGVREAQIVAEASKKPLFPTTKIHTDNKCSVCGSDLSTKYTLDE